MTRCSEGVKSFLKKSWDWKRMVINLYRRREKEDVEGRASYNLEEALGGGCSEEDSSTPLCFSSSSLKLLVFVSLCPMKADGDQ